MWEQQTVKYAKDGRARAEVAEQAELKLGGLTENVAVIEANERTLRDGGIGVDLDVTGLSRLFTSVDWYLDLGILQQDVRRSRLTKGRKNLLPDSRLASIQTLLRNNLYKYSHPLSILGSYRYIPDEALLEWKARHDELVARFYATRDDYIARYEELVAALEDDYREMAAETWAALEARGTDEELSFTQEYDRESFQEAVVRMARSKLISPEEMERELRVVVKMATWMLPVEAAADALDRERTLSKAQEEREGREYWAREARARSEAMEAEWEAVEAEAGARIKKAKVDADEHKAREAQETSVLREAKLELAREAVMEMANPWLEMVQGMRDQVYESANKILTNIHRNGRVVGKQVTAIENLVSLFQVMNTGGDDELAAKIEALAGAMDEQGVEYKRDTQAVMEALGGVVAVSLEIADETATATEWTEWEALEL